MTGLQRTGEELRLFDAVPPEVHGDLEHVLVHARAVGAAQQRVETSRRAAASRHAAAQVEIGALVRVDPTGEMVPAEAQLIQEGRVTRQLPHPLTAADIEPPACSNGYAQVCPVDDYIERLIRTHGLSAPLQALLLRIVLWADPKTGTLCRTQTEIGKALNVSRSTANAYIAQLVTLGLIEASYEERKRNGVIRYLDHDELRRLSLDERIERARRRLVEEEVIEEETVTRRRTTRRRYLT